MPTTQLVPATLKSAAAKPVRASVLPKEKFSVADLLGVLGAVSVRVGGPRSIRVSELAAAPAGPRKELFPVR